MAQRQTIPCAHCGRHGDEHQFTLVRAIDDWLCDECLEAFTLESDAAEDQRNEEDAHE
jgi:CRISPR/Cas system-associated protein Cas10 (large subunit of type III CRISPR-Cas system)